VIADRDFTLFGSLITAAHPNEFGVYADSKLVMFGKPTVGAAVMLRAAAAARGFDLPAQGAGFG